MQRESLPLPSRRRYSSQADSKFREIVQAIARQHAPTQTQLGNLARSYSATGEYLMSCEELRDYIEQVHGQGSYMTGTLVRPSRWRPEGYDVDGVTRLRRDAFLKYAGESGPGRLIDDLYRPLDRYARVHGLRIKKWERCVTLMYADGMHVDITPIIDDPLLAVPYGTTHARVPDRELRRFDPTNPMGLVDSFNEAAKVRAVFTGQIVLDSFREAKASAELVPLPDADEVQDRLLSRLVQLMKVHRNVAFGVPADGAEDLSPKSVVVTALAAAAYALRAPVPHDSELDLMLDVVQHMPTCLLRQPLAGDSEYWLLPNPAAPSSNLAADMNTPARQQAFVQWHGRLIADLEEVLGCIEGRQGLDVLLPLLERIFGTGSAAAVQQLETSRVAATTRRTVIAGAAGAASLVLPARAHTFYGR